jgi:predicted nucleotidyltransferase
MTKKVAIAQGFRLCFSDFMGIPLPYKIVLFGSYAKGEAKPESDIDLMVILDSDYLPRDHDDALRRYSQVRDVIRYDRYKYDMDLKIFTRAEYKKLKDRDSFFV